MPNIWTHIMFCEDVMDSVRYPYQSEINQGYMNLGAQGPDPFFYHNFWPWKKEKSVEKVGNLIHQEKCGDFLYDLILHSANSNNHAKAYVIGFITHHILDRNTHPYIHYRAGYKKNNHQRLEVAIDTILMRKARNLPTWKTPVYKEIDIGYKLNSEVEDILKKTIYTHFPSVKEITTDSFIQDSYRDMKRALRVLYDPLGWKNKLLGSFVSDFSHQPLQNDHDYLNEQHNKWYHSATNESSEESFLELYEHARAQSIDIISEIIRFWQTPARGKQLLLRELIGNYSYDTGKPLELGLTNRYSESIYG
ncbi:zinc dependent phospholipase C family protein [Bacillaceae bacterium S4-13-58]